MRNVGPAAYLRALLFSHPAQGAARGWGSTWSPFRSNEPLHCDPWSHKVGRDVRSTRSAAARTTSSAARDGAGAQQRGGVRGPTEPRFDQSYLRGRGVTAPPSEGERPWLWLWELRAALLEARALRERIPPHPERVLLEVVEGSA